MCVVRVVRVMLCLFFLFVYCVVYFYFVVYVYCVVYVCGAVYVACVVCVCRIFYVLCVMYVLCYVVYAVMLGVLEVCSDNTSAKPRHPLLSLPPCTPLDRSKAFRFQAFRAHVSFRI